MIDAEIGPYKIRRKLAQDRTGVVYLADDTRLERQVVVRLPPAFLQADQDATERFRECAKLLSSLDHPHLTKVHELGEYDGIPFIISPLEGKRPLTALLDEGPLEPRRALRMASAIADGLEAGLEAGLIHGALTPATIIVTAEGDPKIVNLGFSSWNPDASGPPDLADRSIAYASPERCQGRSADSSCDVWSLGVIFYSMLAGRLPFEDAYGAATVYSIQYDSPPPLPESVEPQVRSFLERALDKNPDRRFHDAAQAAAALREIRVELERPSHPSGAVAPSAPPGISRRRALAVAAGIAAFTAAGLWRLSENRRPARPAIPRPSIAVLPLRNLAGAPDQDFFADGMTEELITSMARIGALRVISRTSVMAFKDRQATLSELASRLRVDYVLDASVQRQGSRVRISANLIDVAADESVWAESYEKELTDIFSLQSEVAQTIARQVQVQLSPQERDQFARSEAVRAQSYETYLRGLYLINGRSRESLEQARDLFDQLTVADPGFALGFVGLANAYTLLANIGTAPPEQLWPKAGEAVEKAIELAPDQAEAYSIRGLVRSFWEWNWDAAGEDLRQALRLKPGDAVARQRYGIYLSRLGRHTEAVDEVKRALELDPLSDSISHSLGVVLFMARRVNQATERFLEDERRDPGAYRTHWYLGRCYSAIGRHREAVTELERAYELLQNSFMQASLAQTLALAGRQQDARRILDQLLARSKSEFISASSLAVIFLGLGDHDEALDWLEQAVEQRASLVVWLKVDPAFDPVRADPRFKRLLTAVGLDPA